MLSLGMARPRRRLRKAWEYRRPRRLTLESNPPVYAWLWWNFGMGTVRLLAHLGLMRSSKRSFADPTSPSGVREDGFCGITTCQREVPLSALNRFYCSDDCRNQALYLGQTPHD